MLSALKTGDGAVARGTSGESGARSAKPAKANGTRLNITFSKTLLGRLEELQQETHASTLAEVFRNALVAYGALHAYHKDGCEIIVRDQNGKEKVLTLFL